MAADSGEEEPKNFRVFFIPFFATGHMIPMVDLARQFAVRGVDSTMVVTPANAALIRRTVDRAGSYGHPIRILTFPFPAAEVGLPEGLENLATVPSSDLDKIYHAVDLVRDSHDRLIREHRPDAVVADIPYWWTTGIARELGIPRVTFHPVGVFPQLVMNSLSMYGPHDGLTGEDDGPFVVPHLPDPVEMVRSELPEFLRRRDFLSDCFFRLKEAQMQSYGVVVNTFYELEPAYADLYRQTDCRQGWFVGPLALCYGEDDETAKAERGGDDKSLAANNDRCLRWLEAQAPVSVVFVCFGSWSHFTGEQMREIALGLEASGRPFLWAVKEEDSAAGAEAEWLPEGFEERVGGRGLIARGWAPQVVILNHPAVGAFVTHCGWNSLTEGLSAGKPMITWPLVFEQFISERLVVQLLRVAVRMWDGFRSTLPEEAAKEVVKGEAIANVVARFVGCGGEDDEVEGMRRRAREYAALARSAVNEGGSSCNDLNRLIDGLKMFRQREGTI